MQVSRYRVRVQEPRGHEVREYATDWFPDRVDALVQAKAPRVVGGLEANPEVVEQLTTGDEAWDEEGNGPWVVEQATFQLTPEELQSAYYEWSRELAF